MSLEVKKLNPTYDRMFRLWPIMSAMEPDLSGRLLLRCGINLYRFPS